MGLSLQTHLNRFQFERTVDWRIEIPGLKQYSRYESNFPYRYLFAKSVTLSTSVIEVVEDQYVAGVYNSKMVVPSLSMTVYTDGRGILEDTFFWWHKATFTENGFMPPPSRSGLERFPAMQRINVWRINPVSFSDIQAGWSAKYENETDFYKDGDLIDGYEIDGYLAKMPVFNGNSAAAVRTIDLEIKIVKYNKLVCDKELNTVTDYEKNIVIDDRGWVSWVEAPNNAKAARRFEKRGDDREVGPQDQHSL